MDRQLGKVYLGVQQSRVCYLACRDLSLYIGLQANLLHYFIRLHRVNDEFMCLWLNVPCSLYLNKYSCTGGGRG